MSNLIYNIKLKYIPILTLRCFQINFYAPWVTVIVYDWGEDEGDIFWAMQMKWNLENY